MGFFKRIPRDIQEQAEVDGYGRIEAVTRVVMPIMFPGINLAGLPCTPL